MSGIVVNSCECGCHEFHLVECGDCVLVHHEPLKEGDTMSFSDSYISDLVSDYFHRYAELGQRLGNYYFEIIFSNAVCGKITEFDAKKISYLNYLFKGKRQVKTKKLFHKGIILFLTRNGKGDFADELDAQGKIKWRIIP